MVDGHGHWILGLSSMPLSLCLIQLGRQCQFKPPLPPANLYYFFAFSTFSTWNTSCTTLLLLRGDRAISSLAAATTIQNAGWERKSMVMVVVNDCAVQPDGLARLLQDYPLLP